MYIMLNLIDVRWEMSMNNILNGSALLQLKRMAEVISKRKKQDVNATYDGLHLLKY